MILRLHAVQILAVAQFSVKADTPIDAMDNGRVGAAFVNDDFLRRVVRVDDSFLITLCRLVDCAVKIFPVTGDFAVGLIHSPVRPNRTLALAKTNGQHWQYLQCPPVHVGVIDKDAELLNHLFNKEQAQRISRVPASAHQHDVQHGRSAV